MAARKAYSERAHEYCRKVVSGKILASKWIRLACQRHLDDLKTINSRWYFNAAKANKVCAFIESLSLADGVPFTLQPFQIWLVASLLGWMDKDGTRKYIEALILIPKGNGKSPLAAALGLWFAFLDGEPKAEVYCGAMSLLQAMEVFKPAIDFVSSQPAFNRLGIQALKKSIYSTRTGGSFRPVVGRGRHGARPKLAILDELHQAISPDLYDTFKTGCNKTPNSLMLTISTAGVAAVENPCFQLEKQAQKILEGTLPGERFFAAVYCADDSVEWSSMDALRMANPNLGISNDAEKIRLAQEEAVRNPGKQNIVRSMHLNQWTSAASSWMNMEKWKLCRDSDLTPERVKDLPCWLGSDLASKLDLCACVLLFREDVDEKPHYFALTRTYLPQARVDLPENTHYRDWVARDHLVATPGSSIDYSKIEADALEDIATYQVQELAYDPRYADQWSQRVSDPSGIVRVETPPNAALLSPAMKELEGAIYDGRFHHDGHPVLTWCMSNLLTRETSVGNYTMPEKPKPESKIDAAVALILAMARARVAEPTETRFMPFVF